MSQMSCRTEGIAIGHDRQKTILYADLGRFRRALGRQALFGSKAERSTLNSHASHRMVWNPKDCNPGNRDPS